MVRMVVVGCMLSVSISMARAEPKDGGLPKARQLLLNGSPQQAATVAERILSRRENDQAALQVLVAARCQLGQIDQAIDLITRLDPRLRSLARSVCLQHAATSRDKKQDRLKLAVWGGVALTGASLVAALVLGTQVSAAEDDKEALLRHYVDEHRGAERWVASRNVCESAPDSAGDLKSVCARGKRLTIAQNVMLGTAIVSGIATGALLYYLSYRDEAKAPRRAAVLPSFGPGSGSVSVLFEY